jgi:hypothetical protein
MYCCKNVLVTHGSLTNIEFAHKQGFPWENTTRVSSTITPLCATLCLVKSCSVSSGQVPPGATVWVGHVMGKESRPPRVESFLVDTRLVAHKIFNNLANSFPPQKSVERFSKSASDSYVTSWRTVVQLRDQYQSELVVP